MENHKKLDDQKKSHSKFIRLVKVMTPNGKKVQYAMLISCFILALLILVGLLLPSISYSAFFVQLSSTYIYPFIAISGLSLELIIIFFIVIVSCRLILCDEIKENSLKIKSEKRKNSIVENIKNIDIENNLHGENKDIQGNQIGDVENEGSI